MEKNMNKERSVAFVVVRLSSSRFPGKQLRHIGDRPLLCWIIDHLRGCKELDEIAIATVAEKSNEPLRAFAREHGISCFWYEGEVDHVTTRLRRAAEAFDAEICVLVSGDCPLVHAAAIDRMIHQLRLDPDADIVRILPDKSEVSLALHGVNVDRKRAWQLADDLSDRHELREHLFPVIGMRPDLFKKAMVSLPTELYAPFHRFSVDSWADMEFMNQVYAEVKARGWAFELPNVLRMLKEKPELREINAHVHQRRLVETIKKVLFVVDAGGTFGYGHLMRSTELALQIVERMSWPVTFLTDDEHAERLLKERGFRVTWGAVGRPASRSDEPLDPPIEPLVSGHDLLILDVYGPRDLPSGWRQEIGATDIPVAVMDRMGEWTQEADMILFPGVTSPSEEEPPSESGPEIVAGQNHIILRREIRRRMLPKEKLYDLLIDLHQLEQQHAVERFAAHHHLKIHMVDGSDSDFPEWLARSRFLLASFGYSFYEALALDTFPIAWPLSESHRKDAVRFYRRMGLAPALIGPDDDLERVLCPLIEADECAHVSLTDGTPAIVRKLAELAERGSRRSPRRNRRVIGEKLNAGLPKGGPAFFANRTKKGDTP